MDRRTFLLAPSALAFSTCGVVDARATAQRHHSIFAVGGALTMRAHLYEPISGRAAYSVNGIGRNPTLVIARGSILQAKLENALPQPTTIHWHGLSPPGVFDGAGFDPVLPGKSFTYRFEVNERAGLYWYHPHPHHFAAEQVYHGMAGALVVRDQEDLAFEQELGTRLGESDLPIVLQDAFYRAGAWQPYAPDQADCIDGFFGNTIHANGVSDFKHAVSAGFVRLRLLNASTARGLLIAFRQGNVTLPFWLVGNDGGFLPRASQEERVFLYPAERVDLVLDCRTLRKGAKIHAISETFENQHQHEETKPKSDVHRIHAGARAFSRLTTYEWCENKAQNEQGRDGMKDDGEALALFTLEITAQPARSGALVKTFRSRPFAALDASRIDRTFQLKLDRERGWTINGKKFHDADAAIHVKRGAQEIWEIHNAPVSMPHPMHLHGFHFRVLKRTGLVGPADALAVHGGLLASDTGLKDTVTVWPNERVRIAIDFSTTHSGPQRYMFHCHNLEHEDAMMMLPVTVS